MPISVEKLYFSSIEAITAYSMTDDYLFTLDELSNYNMSQDLGKTDILGANGTKVGQLKKNKTVTGSATNGLISLPAMAADLGATVTRGSSRTFRWKDIVTVSSNAATLNYTPAGTAGSQLYGVYKLNTEGTLGQSFEQMTGTVTTGKVTLTTKTLGFYTGDLADNDRIVVFYDRTVADSTVVSNLADEVAKNVHLVIDCLAEDRACNVYYAQIDIPKASLGGKFEIGAGDSQVMHNIEWEALASNCTGTVSKFWDFIVVSDDIIEAAE